MHICMYGASSDQINPLYIAAAEQLGVKMAERGHALVFGGGAAGLMGAAARGMTSRNGQIIGVAPSFFNVDGVLYEGCTDFIYTETMHERKFRMEEMSDAFIISPGGIGTFEEFFEVLTLKQLGRHNKPIALFNVDGYYAEMHALIDKAINERFMQRACRRLVESFADPDALLNYLESYDNAQMLPEQMKFL